VRFLPALDIGDGEPVVRILFRLRRDVDHHSRSHEALDRDGVGRPGAFREVDRRIEVGPPCSGVQKRFEE
jgi:hypothetical protein